MIVTIKCDGCETKLQAQAGLTATTVICSNCSAEIDVPAMSIGKGTEVGGFRIEKPLGQGAMGQVFLATQLSMDRRVALKILPQMIAQDDEMVDRFVNEVKTLAHIDHPNIVTAFEAGMKGGVYYLAMTYIDGEDLGARIKREGVIPEKEALKIIRKVAEALAYVWDEHRILHNDMKPDNIMIDRKGEVRIMDLGLSKKVFQCTGFTMTGVVAGTPNYMSPEQACSSRDIDFRSDQYALGATLYRLVTGSLAYKGSSVAELLAKKITDPIPAPREVNPEVSEACEHLLTVLMARDRKQRYKSWEAAISDIDRVLGGHMPLAKLPEAGESAIMPLETSEPGQADENPPAEKIDKTIRMEVDVPEQKHGRGFAAVLVFAALLAIGISYGVMKYLQRDETAPEEITEPLATRPVSTIGWHDDFIGQSGYPASDLWSRTGEAELHNDAVRLNAPEFAWGACSILGNLRPYLTAKPPNGIQLEVDIKGFTVLNEDSGHETVCYVDAVLASEAEETAFAVDADLVVLRLHYQRNQSYTYAVGIKRKGDGVDTEPTWIGRAVPLAKLSALLPLRLRLTVYEDAIHVYFEQDGVSAADVAYAWTAPPNVLNRGMGPVICVGNQNTGRGNVEIDRVSVGSAPPPTNGM